MRADTISTFDFTGTSVFYGLGGDMNTVAGTVTIDTTTGVAESLSFVAGGVPVSGVGGQNGPVVFAPNSPQKISFDAGSLIGYMGSAFDLNSGTDLYVGHVTLESPAMVPPAASTPEPSSMVLLGTGMVGFAGLVRRRIKR